jgi:hypothetical protein
MPIQLIIRNPLDRDAREYIGRAGVSDAAARLQLNEFVRGIKGLGVWNSMVCWPLRSTQNSGGASTTAYSLGGLGTFDGTLVGGPTWGTNGMTFTNASSQYITFNGPQIIAGNSDYTILAVAKLTNVVTSNLVVVSLGNNRGGLAGVASNGSTQVRNAQWTVTSGFGGAQLANGPTTSWFASILSGDSVSAKNYVNSSTPFATLPGDYRVNPSSTTLPQIGAHNLTVSPNSANGFWNGDIAAGVIWNVKMTDAQVASIYALYKQTLGTGLGLP